MQVQRLLPVARWFLAKRVSDGGTQKFSDGKRSLDFGF